MKKTAENRYPHSATLFRFCKEALALRYEGNVKVIDQDVGAILGYDPADCSHWKKGKKNIRSLGTLRSIADHLGLDEQLLIEIAGGQMSLEEAVFEYKGYGPFYIKGVRLDELKKDFFRQPQKWGGEATERTFEEVFNLARPSLARFAEDVLNMGSFKEAPIYIPEVLRLFQGVRLDFSEEGPQFEASRYNGQLQLYCHGPEIRPYVRFLLARELYLYLAHEKHPSLKDLLQSPQEIRDVQANIFAGMLLIPGSLLRKEVGHLQHAFNLVAQLAKSFWVSPALVNHRLKDYMEHGC